MAKLILGTASFGPKPYGEGVTEPPNSEEIRRILDTAHRGGITILEGSEAYGCNEILKDPRFDVIYKVKHPYTLDRVFRALERPVMALLYHYSNELERPESIRPDPRLEYTGVSAYSHKQILGTESMIEVPLNLENKEFLAINVGVKLVRSVFGRGILLKNHTVKECLDFIKAQPNIHGVVVGVNSNRELKEILEAWKGE